MELLLSHIKESCFQKHFSFSPLKQLIEEISIHNFLPFNVHNANSPHKKISYRINSEKISYRFNCLLKAEEDCNSNRNGKIGKNGEGVAMSGYEAPEETKGRRL